MIGGFTALLTMVIIVVLLRLYVRVWMARDVKADDCKLSTMMGYD